MQNVLDIRDMHTAIHSLYLVKAKPKTTLTAAWLYEQSGEQSTLAIVEANTQNLGEVHWRFISGGNVTVNGIPTTPCTFDDGERRYNVIGRFDFWGI